MNNINNFVNFIKNYLHNELIRTIHREALKRLKRMDPEMKVIAYKFL